MTKKSPEGTAFGRATELCPALTETFRSLHGDPHSKGMFMKACTMVQRPSISVPSGDCLPPPLQIEGLAKNRLCTFLVDQDVHGGNLLTTSTHTPVESKDPSQTSGSAVRKCCLCLSSHLLGLLQTCGSSDLNPQPLIQIQSVYYPRFFYGNNCVLMMNIHCKISSSLIEWELLYEPGGDIYSAGGLPIMCES